MTRVLEYTSDAIEKNALSIDASGKVDVLWDSVFGCLSDAEARLMLDAINDHSMFDYDLDDVCDWFEV